MRALRLSDSPIQSLDGLESLPELHELRVTLAHKLADVSALKRADIRGSHRCRASNAPAFGWNPPGFRVEFVARDVVDPKPHWAYQNNLRC